MAQHPRQGRTVAQEGQRDDLAIGNDVHGAGVPALAMRRRTWLVAVGSPPIASCGTQRNGRQHLSHRTGEIGCLKHIEWSTSPSLVQP